MSRLSSVRAKVVTLAASPILLAVAVGVLHPYAPTAYAEAEPTPPPVKYSCTVNVVNGTHDCFNVVGLSVVSINPGWVLLKLTRSADEGALLRATKAVEGAWRTHGRSKDHRPDLPQVVIAMAVTREGIPVRVWTFPGDESDQVLIRTVKDDLRSWNLGRVIWAFDRGFASAENHRYPQRGGGH